MTTAKPLAIEPEVAPPYRVALNVRSLEMTEHQFLKLCSENGDLRLELTSEKELIVMPPVFSESGLQEHDLAMQVGIWAKQDGAGRVFSPSAGFTLPNGAVRAPDVSWVLVARWEALSEEDRDGFAKICPDFVIELRSRSDTLGDVEDQLQEYMENGARLGWLIDPQNQRVHVYRTDHSVEILVAPESVSGDPVLPGFVLGLSTIW